MRWTALLTLVLATALAGCGDLSVSRKGGRGQAAAQGAPVASPSPRIVVSEPRRASFLPVGPVTVRGQAFAVRPDAPITSVQIEGQAVPVAADGTFQGQVTLHRGANVIDLSCVDAAGNAGSAAIGVLAGTFRPLSQPIAQAAGVRLNDVALSAFGKIIEQVIWATDLTARLASLGPLYNTNLLWIQIWATVQQVRFRDVFVDVDADTQGVWIRADVRDLIVDTMVEADVGLGGRLAPTPARVQAASAVLEGRLRLDPNPDGTVRSSILQPSLQLNGFQATSSSRLIQVALPLVAGAVEKAIRDAVADLLANDARPAIDRALAAYLQPQGWDVLGAKYAYDLRLEQANYDNNGLTWRCSFNSVPVHPTGVDRGAPGSLVTPGPMPRLETTRGALLVLDDDAMNRALYGAWAGGVFDFTIDAAFLRDRGVDPNSIPLTVGAITQFVPEVAAAAEPSAPLRLRVAPKLPPVLEVTGAPNLVSLSASEVRIVLEVDRGNGWEVLLEAVAHANLGANLELSGRGFALRMATLPDLRFEIVDEPLVELDDRKLQVMLGLVLTPTIPRLLNDVNVLPVPHVNQLAVFNVATAPGGPNADFLTAEADLQR